MIAAQYEFVPYMLQGAAYNCNSLMPPGQAWADEYGVRQLPFGIYSIVFGVITEVLYIPCAIGLRKDVKTPCFKIMFWLSLLDMVAIAANSIMFGVLLLKGAVYCSDPVMTLGVGMVGYGMWFASSACCLLLGVNRLIEFINLSVLYTDKRTNIYLLMCCAYGLFMMLFTRPVIVNSTHQSMFFTPFIPGHGFEEYVNLPHAVHNVAVAVLSCLLYLMLIIVLVVKRGRRSAVINNMPVFIQVMLICGANLIATLIYVYMNFFPAPPAVIIAGQVCWQLIHGLPPFIYLALNKSIRKIALQSIGLDGILYTTRVVQISTTQGTTIF